MLKNGLQKGVKKGVKNGLQKGVKKGVKKRVNKAHLVPGAGACHGVDVVLVEADTRGPDALLNKRKQTIGEREMWERDERELKEVWLL